MNEKLFIGGPRDGEWLMVPDRPLVRVPIRRVAVRLHDMTPRPELLKSAEYRLEKINADSSIFVFYAHQSLSTAEAIHQLILNYRPSQPTK